MTTVEGVSVSGFYEAIIENAESNILILDKDFSIVSLNPAFYWVFLEAYDIQLKKGVKLFDAMRPVIPLVGERWRIRCVAAMKGLSVSDEEEIESHGQNFSWKIYFKSLHLGTEQFVSIYTRNVSSERIFHDKIVKQAANLRSIINSFAASIWLLNERFELIDFNDQTFAHFSNTYNVTLRTSKSFVELFPETMLDLRQRWTDRLSESLLKKEKTSHVDHINRNGEAVICETIIIPVFSDEHVIGLTVSMKDMVQAIDEGNQSVRSGAE